jgi:hypothetical protein
MVMFDVFLLCFMQQTHQYNPLQKRTLFVRQGDKVLDRNVVRTSNGTKPDTWYSLWFILAALFVVRDQFLSVLHENWHTGPSHGVDHY